MLVYLFSFQFLLDIAEVIKLINTIFIFTAIKLTHILIFSMYRLAISTVFVIIMTSKREVNSAVGRLYVRQMARRVSLRESPLNERSTVLGIRLSVSPTSATTGASCSSTGGYRCVKSTN